MNAFVPEIFTFGVVAPDYAESRIDTPPERTRNHLHHRLDHRRHPRRRGF